MHTSPAQAWRRFQIRRSAAEMLIIGEKGRSNDIIYRRSYNCGDDRQTGWLGGPDLEVTHTCTPPMKRVPGIQTSAQAQGTIAKEKARGGRWKAGQTFPPRNSLCPYRCTRQVAGRNPKQVFTKTMACPLLSFLSIPYLFTPFFPLFPERGTRLFSSSRSLFLFLSSFSSSPFYTEFRECTCAFTHASSNQPHRVTLTSIQINRPWISRTRSPARLRG